MLYKLLFVVLAIASVYGGVVELTPDNFDEVIDGSKHVFVKFYAPWCGHCKNMAPALEQVGEAFEKEKDVVIAKLDADAHKQLGSRFGVSGFPTLKWFPKGSTNPEAYEGGRTAEDIISFVNDKAGTRVRIKKAPSSVVDLDDSNFDSIVKDSTKNVLVEFYAPWCGHCKRLAPDYEKVGQIFANEPEVVIAKIDADAHKEAGSRYGVTGFPTLKWFPKNQKDEPVAYESGRDIPSFVEFINKNAGTLRTTSGALSEQAGRVSALDDLASKYVKDGADKDALSKEAEGVVKGLSGNDEKNGKFYLKVMSVLKTKGKDFLTSEPARLNRMLESSVTPAKADEFTIRKNIIAAFH